MKKTEKKQEKLYNIESVKLDFEKLQTIMLQRKITYDDLSVQIGRNHAYLSNILRKDSIVKKPVANVIGMVLDIDPDEIIVKKPESKPERAELEVVPYISLNTDDIIEKLDKVIENQYVLQNAMIKLINELCGYDDKETKVVSIK